MDYHTLPFYTVDTRTSQNNQSFIPLEDCPVFTPELVHNIRDMIHCDFQMTGKVHVLQNVFASEHAQQMLFYPQAFFLFDSEAGYYTKRKNLHTYEFRYTLDGEGCLEYCGKKYTLTKGEGYFIDCMEPHFYYAGKNGWKSTVFHFNGVLCKEIFSLFSCSRSVKFSEVSFPAFEHLQYQILKSIQKVTPYLEYQVSCMINLLLTELLSSTANKEDVTDNAIHELIPEIIHYLRENYMEKITVDKLTLQFGISRTSLFQEFKKYTGFSPGDYLMQIRINHAKLLLTGSNDSIEHVATLTGFNDAGHFSQLFKREVGITPLKYRKM